MDKESINNKRQFYENILEKINTEISSKDFENVLREIQKIDLNHYSKIIEVKDLKRLLDGYKKECELEEKSNISNKKIFILLPGNPEIIFRICLEILKYNVDLILGIQDFCLAQNTLIVETINNVIKNTRLKNKIELKNLLKDSEIISNANLVDRVICVGDSNLYNRLKKQINNIELNPYGIFEIYSDSENFEDLEKTFFDYCYQNEFEVENYNDLEFEDCLKLINKNGYNFCSVLFSNDKIKQKEFKEKINSKYVIINQNPFKKIKFEL